ARCGLARRGPDLPRRLGSMEPVTYRHGRGRRARSHVGTTRRAYDPCAAAGPHPRSVDRLVPATAEADVGRAARGREPGVPETRSLVVAAQVDARVAVVVLRHRNAAGIAEPGRRHGAGRRVLDEPQPARDVQDHEVVLAVAGEVATHRLVSRPAEPDGR